MIEQQHVNVNIITVSDTFDFVHEIPISDCLVLIICCVACVVLIFGQLSSREIAENGSHFVPCVAIAEYYVRVFICKRV